MTLLNEISIACPTCVSMNVSFEFFRVICPAIELFLFIRGCINDLATNPSQISAYIHIQLLSHTFYYKERGLTETVIKDSQFPVSAELIL